jgi:urea transport system permease protein
MRSGKKGAALVAALFVSFSSHALQPAALDKLANGDNDEKVEAIGALVAEGDPTAIEVLTRFARGEVEIGGKKVEVVVNNRLRSAVADALAAMRLLAPDRAARLAAAKELAGGGDAAMLPLVKKALDNEGDAEIRPLLELAEASMEMKSTDKPRRLAAIRKLGGFPSPNSKTLLAEAVRDNDEDIRFEAQKSLRKVEGKLAWGERAGLLFAGVSLGSILLLAALGLAITYGLMGVINMAHGELIMIGAYTTYVVQGFFRNTSYFDWYLLAAVPASFVMAALVGMALERGVIRWLYGRPLETLLATWGISLMLIQLVRTLFGAQNVQVENPAFMSGGLQVLSNVVLPWSRIMIIAFAGLVLFLVYFLLVKTRLGLFVRGVTQNRAMASCVGVPTARVDTWAFGLGSGIAGLAGCALSQLGNVGPDLGQGYIVDSFLVVVFGGVGQLAGTVYAALTLGFANKFLEAWSGAVLAKIALLVFIIIFIQRRPQGMFALKGRSVEA